MLGILPTLTTLSPQLYGDNDSTAGLAWGFSKEHETSE